MEFRILGPLEVLADGRVLPLGGAKQRALLALLLLHANEPVSVDRIVDELWGERPPATAVKNVQVYVSHLRKALGEGVLVTTPPGYTLRVADGALDAARAQRALATAGSRPSAEQVELLEAALGSWRGRPLADLADLAFARAEIGRLEGLRLQLLKRRIGAELELGRHEKVVVELEQLVAAYPLDEHLRGQLMLALYRSGRQAEALAVYRDARRTLADELGLEPDEELRSLEQKILAHDPALRPPRPAEAAPPAPRAGSSRWPRRSVILGAGLVAAAALTATVLALTSDDPAPALTVPANSVVVVDADSGSVLAAIRVGRGPEDVVAGAGAVWVANANDRTLSRIDPKTLRVTKTVGLGFEPTDLAADAQQVWVAGGYDHALWRVDRDGLARLKLRFRERSPLPSGFERGPAGVAVGPGTVWLSHGDELTELDSVTGEVQRTVKAGGRWDDAIAAARSWVWVGVNNSLDPGPEIGLDLINLAGGVAVTRTRLVSPPSEILFASDRLWVALRFASTVAELDPASGVQRRSFAAGHLPAGIVFHNDALWITNEVEAVLRRVDVRSGDTQLVLPLDHRLGELAIAEGRLFIAVRGP